MWVSKTPEYSMWLKSLQLFKFLGQTQGGTAFAQSHSHFFEHSLGKCLFASLRFNIKVNGIWFRFHHTRIDVCVYWYRFSLFDAWTLYSIRIQSIKLSMNYSKAMTQTSFFRAHFIQCSIRYFNSELIFAQPIANERYARRVQKIMSF